MAFDRMDRSCQICGGATAPFRRGWVFRCAGCGVLSSSLVIDIPEKPTEAALDERRRETGLEATRTLNNARLLDAVAALVPAGAGLLDVGSGPGFLLGEAVRRGFQAEGIEPDANTVEAARARGAAARHGYFPAALEDEEAFDVIVFNDVLEHIPDLTGALSASARHLQPGGVLCLNCPDRRGFFYRTAALLDRLGVGGPYARLWQKGLPSPHVWYFTPADLIAAARPHGLEPAGTVRLETLELKGLWSRIRYVRDQPLALSLAAFAFALAAYPFARLLPSDAVACLFRKARPPG
jgi:SAM-dependent methyltransferase